MRTRVYVDIDLDDVVDELDTDALVRALAARGQEALTALGLTSRNIDDLRIAVRNDDGRRAIDLLRPVFGRVDREKLAERLSALPRDPATGRPIIQ